MQFCSCVCVSTVGVGAASFLRLIEDSRPGYSSIPSSLEEKVEPVLDKHKAGAMKGRLWHMAFETHVFVFHLGQLFVQFDFVSVLFGGSEIRDA